MLHTFAAVMALADPSGPVVDVRIADVIADPERYGGQTLRIRGQIDACYSFSCQICPEDMTPETLDRRQCLGIAFDDFMSEVDRSGPTDAPFTPTAWPEIEAAFRFSVVTAEGRFDPSCLTGRPWPPEPPIETSGADDELPEIICVDRASTFRRVQVRTVHRRIPSNEGLVSGRDGGLLVPASGETAALVEAAYRADVASYNSDPVTDPIMVLVPEEPDFRIAQGEARLCICLKADCSTEWPKRFVSILARTPNDPYRCYPAVKINGAWRVYPG